MRMEFVQEFHRKFGFKTLDQPGFLDDERMASRLTFLLEELVETATCCGQRLVCNEELGAKFIPMSPSSAMAHKDLEGALDGLIDLIYVAFGTADLMGFNHQCPLVPPDNGQWSVWQEASLRVQQANMQKSRVETGAESKRGTIFDVRKPEGWVAPAYDDILPDEVL